MEYLPADILYLISYILNSQNIDYKEKLNNTKEILKLCRINKRFNELYGKNSKIWPDLWKRDISDNLPQDNVKNNYTQALSNLISRIIPSDPISISNAFEHNYDRALKNILSIFNIKLSFVYDVFRTASQKGNLDIINYILNKYEIPCWVITGATNFATSNNHVHILDKLISSTAFAHNIISSARWVLTLNGNNDLRTYLQNKYPQYF